MLVGNMEDIVQEPGNSESTAESNSTTAQYERESRIQIAYDMLSDRMKDIEEREDVKKQSDKLLQSIKSLQDTIMKIQAPNMKV